MDVFVSLKKDFEVGRRKRSSTLPHTFVLATDSYPVMLVTLHCKINICYLFVQDQFNIQKEVNSDEILNQDFSLTLKKVKISLSIAQLLHKQESENV